MEFNSHRQLILAGIDPNESQSLNESARASKRETLVETQLRQAIRSEIKETLVETRLRKQIRSEIEAIVQEIKASGGSDSSWMYGDNQPRNSKKGSVTMGLLGIGFASEGS